MEPHSAAEHITQLQYLLLEYSQQPLRGFQGSSKGTSENPVMAKFVCEAQSSDAEGTGAPERKQEEGAAQLKRNRRKERTASTL
jgi:hypothetical protein